MIKLICFIHRRADLDRADFHRHWREEHGPLIAGIPELSRHVLRYEQNHRLEEDYARDATETCEFDGATLMSFESMSEYKAFASEPLYAEKIAPDEARFMDRARTMFFFSAPAEIKFGGPAEMARGNVKLLALMRRKAGLSIDDFHSHWSGPHAALFRDNPALRDRTLAYQQSHRLTDDYAANPSTDWDGLAEQAYTTLEDFYAGAGGGPFEEIVVPDEELFIDRAATRFLLCGPAERVLGGEMSPA